MRILMVVVMGIVMSMFIKLKSELKSDRVNKSYIGWRFIELFISFGVR